MATESISDRRDHIRSIGVTAVAALLGVGAALASERLSADAETLSEAASTDVVLYLVLGVIVAEILVINVSGIYTDEELGIKHYLFVAFMTFSLWFVTWGILLTSQFTG